MTKIVQKTVTLQSLQTCQLTKEQVYRLLKCAIKDDDRLVDTLIQKIYDTMIAFDPKRAEIVIGLIVNRHEAGEPAFHDFLRDIKVSVDNLPFLSDRCLLNDAVDGDRCDNFVTRSHHWIVAK